MGAIDMCPIATATYQENFPNTRVFTRRLEDIALPALKRSIGNIDILLSSPECTNHTCAKGAAPRDERSRATAMHVVEYARFFRPRWFILENVVHMRPWSRYNELKQELADLGYNLAEQVLEKVDVIVTSGTPPVVAAKQATSVIPIVFAVPRGLCRS